MRRESECLLCHTAASPAILNDLVTGFCRLRSHDNRRAKSGCASLINAMMAVMAEKN